MSFQLRLRLHNSNNMRTNRFTYSRTHTIRQYRQFLTTSTRPAKTFHRINRNNQRLPQQVVPITSHTTIRIIIPKGLQRQHVQRVQLFSFRFNRVKTIHRTRPTIVHPYRLLGNNFATGHAAWFQRGQATNRIRGVYLTIQRVRMKTIPKLLRRKVQIRVTQLRVVIVDALI